MPAAVAETSTAALSCDPLAGKRLRLDDEAGACYEAAEKQRKTVRTGVHE